MAWEHLSISKPHLVYIILGGFTTLFMLCSSIIKERMYIGEATVATLCGVIFGPHAANLINPLSWGNTDLITLEFARIVLVVQCFAVGVELPRSYMEKHWRSVVFLLVPVMTFGWLVTSLFIWAMFYQWANWLDCLCLAACVTATDPVLASSVVGKGKFAKRVPKHLRDLLSAESGCNDGMAFPFIYLALYIIRYRTQPDEVALHWICVTILYECVFGAIYGVTIGYIARRLIRYSEEKDFIDRESFLVFYFVLALFCAGSGSLLGMDDLLIGFACGVGFSNDGWFTEKTEEAHVSNVIDLLLNLAFFVYFGTVIPWASFNNGYYGLEVWRLVVIALLVLFFRRIPIMMALKPLIPDIKTWREALFAGHFGPIGVGAIFVAILARAELETGGTDPLEDTPPAPFPHANVIALIWPITTFLVITSIVVHGSSIAVFTLGKHINTLQLTMSYTKAQEEASWMDRLPRIQSRSKSQMSRESSPDEKAEYPHGGVAGLVPGTFLRRQREEDNPSRVGSRSSSRHRSRRSKQWDNGKSPGGPISQSAIAPTPREVTTPIDQPTSRSDSETLALKGETSESSDPKKDDALSPGLESVASPGEIYEEGDQTVYEDEDGNVLAVQHSHGQGAEREEFEREEGKRLMHEAGADKHHGIATEQDLARTESGGQSKSSDKKAVKSQSSTTEAQIERPGAMWRAGMQKMSTIGRFRRDTQPDEPKAKPTVEKKHGPARAYQYGNVIIVEDEDGEVIKKYDIPGPARGQGESHSHSIAKMRIGQMGKKLGLVGKDSHASSSTSASGPSSSQAPQSAPDSQAPGRTTEDDDDDHTLRFTAGGRRMSKAEFIGAVRDMDPKRRVQVVEESNAPEGVKREARKEAREHAGVGRDNNNTSTATTSDVPVVREHSDEEKGDGMAAIQHVNTHDSDSSLRLVDSGGQEVPFHDIGAELRKHQLRSTAGETAAERRRRAALQRPEESDSDDDGTERVPPASSASASASAHAAHAPPASKFSEAGETAAERRRRLGALGLRGEVEEDSESESDEEEEGGEEEQGRGRSGPPAPTASSASSQHRPNIRFAEQPVRQEATGKGPRLRWGKNIGR